MEAHLGGVGVLRVRVAVLGRVRAGWIYADTLRGPLCPPRADRDQAVRVVVRVDPGRVRDPALPHLRLAVGEARAPAAVRSGQIRTRADVCGTGLRAADAGRGRRTRRSESQPAVARGRLFHLGARGGVPVPCGGRESPRMYFSHVRISYAGI